MVVLPAMIWDKVKGLAKVVLDARPSRSPKDLAQTSPAE
jgi:hypothetical protein